MPLGLTATELAIKWNETLRQLNCKLATPQLPPGVDKSAYESNPAAIRVPETDAAKYSTYSAYVDIAAALIAIVDLNNKRIADQLQKAGITLPG